MWCILYQFNTRTLSLRFTHNGTRLENTSPSTDVFKDLVYEWYKMLNIEINTRTLSLRFTHNGTRLENTSPSTDVFKDLAYEWYKMPNIEINTRTLCFVSHITVLGLKIQVPMCSKTLLMNGIKCQI